MTILWFIFTLEGESARLLKEDDSEFGEGLENVFRLVSIDSGKKEIFFFMPSSPSAKLALRIRFRCEEFDSLAPYSRITS
jgi:hypothetical protein